MYIHTSTMNPEYIFLSRNKTFRFNAYMTDLPLLVYKHAREAKVINTSYIKKKKQTHAQTIINYKRAQVRIVTWDPTFRFFFLLFNAVSLLFHRVAQTI